MTWNDSINEPEGPYLVCILLFLYSKCRQIYHRWILWVIQLVADVHMVNVCKYTIRMGFTTQSIYHFKKNETYILYINNIYIYIINKYIIYNIYIYVLHNFPLILDYAGKSHQSNS